ncbi:MAG: TlpA family protein disulfide reductase [Bacteroidales bacterium]|nr:TlpA family protein disulfide reductase [Bacteroidales bacterium]
MKKSFLIAAAVLVALTGCKSKMTSQEALDAFQAEVETLMDTYRTEAEKIDADEALSEELKGERFDDLQENTIEGLTASGKKYIKMFPADTLVAPTVIASIYSYLEDDDLEDILSGLSPEVKQTKIVSMLSSELESKKATAVGKKFTDFTVDHVAGVDKDGNPVYEKKSLSDFVGKGKVMLVDFWSPWCPPCKAEIPNIKAIWEKYHGEDFDVLSVAVWEESRKMDWHNTIDTAAFYGMKWLQLNNGHQEPATLYGISGIPHMILFDKDGTILKRGDDLRGEKTAKAVAEVLGR